MNTDAIKRWRDDYERRLACRIRVIEAALGSCGHAIDKRTLLRHCRITPIFAERGGLYALAERWGITPDVLFGTVAADLTPDVRVGALTDRVPTWPVAPIDRKLLRVHSLTDPKVRFAVLTARWLATGAVRVADVEDALARPRQTLRHMLEDTGPTAADLVTCAVMMGCDISALTRPM